MKESKNLAKLYHREYDVSQRVAVLKRAQKYDADWKNAEQVIHQEAKNIGRPDLLPALRDARVKLAKNYDVERALNLGSGNVEAPILGRMLDKRGVDAITGGLRTIGKMQQAFPSFMRAAPSGQSAPGVSYLRPLATAGALAMGAEEGRERFGMSPYWLAAAAYPLLSGPARQIALSRLMQGAPTYGPGMAARIAQSGTGPLAQRLIPLSGVAAQGANQ